MTGFHGHPLLLRPRIFIYWNTLQNSDYYCLSRLPLIIPLQSIPNHVRKWPSIKMQATLILIITQGRYQPPSPSLCNINKINISKRFTILPFILIAVTSSSSGTKMDRLDITCWMSQRMYNTYSKPSPQHFRRWKHAIRGPLSDSRWSKQGECFYQKFWKRRFTHTLVTIINWELLRHRGRQKKNKTQLV